MYPNENDLKPRIAAIRLICRVKWVLLQDIKRVSYIRFPRHPGQQVERIDPLTNTTLFSQISQESIQAFPSGRTHIFGQN